MSRWAAMVVIAAITVIGCGAWAGEPSAADSGTLPQATALLDSWSGQRDQLKSAKVIIDRVLRDDPKNYEALAQLARYQVKSGYIRSRAARHHTTIGEFEPGTLESAEAALKKALDINPRFAKAYVLLGHIYTQEERPQEAAAALRAAEQIGTDDPWLDLNWADLHSQAGETAAAEERWQRVISRAGTQPVARDAALGYLRKSYEDAGKTNEAIGIYEAQIGLHPNNAWLRSEFAVYLHCHGQNDRAIVEHRAALKVMDFGIGRRDYAGALYKKWADMVLGGGNDTEAEPYFRDAQRVYPWLADIMVYEGARGCSVSTVRALHTKKNIPLDLRVEDGSTALLVAVNKNENAAVKELLEMGANPNIADVNGWTPLISAADEGNEENVRLLLAYGGDTHQTIRGRNAAVQAEVSGYPQLARLIRESERKPK